MYLLVVILDKTSDLEKVIGKFTEIGVPGATVIDTMGIGKNTLIASDAPVIASLRRIFEKDMTVYNHMVLSVIDDKSVLDAAAAAVVEIVGGFDKPDTGIMFTIKLDQVYGFTEVERK